MSQNLIMHGGTLHRLSAFTTTPGGGNPAGVWVGERLPEPDVMQRIAADVGYSETAFVTPAEGFVRTVRYYSPQAEVPFCGHATIAAGVLLGETSSDGRYQFDTTIGPVTVHVNTTGEHAQASLVSVLPKHRPADDTLLADALAALVWDSSDLDPAIPPACAYAGAWHLVLAVREQARLEQLDYDFDTLRRVMLDAGLTTLQLVWREDAGLFHARNPFPVGGVYEDPATGAAAAALGGYLRDAGLLSAPATLVIRQGHTMGRPGELLVSIPAHGGIMVTGSAIHIPT